MKNNQFEMITDNSVWNNKFSLEDIDYSILLAKVFGKPVETASAFMYLFRRYGFTNRGSDDYKELCSYAFHTNNEEIIVRWGMAYPGTYQHHLCAFVDKRKRWEWEQEKNRPYLEWRDRMKEWAKKQHGYILYSMIELYKTNEDETLMEFIGTPEQKADIEKTMSDNGITGNDDKAFWAVHSIKEKQHRQCCKEYEEIEPHKVSEPLYKVSEPLFDFDLRYSNPIVAAEKQHEWILTFDEDNLLRQTYFAAMALFEDWKRPTYVRDVYFNLLGENESTFALSTDEEESFYYAERSNNAGYGIPTALFEGDNFKKVQDLLAK